MFVSDNRPVKKRQHHQGITGGVGNGSKCSTSLRAYRIGNLVEGAAGVLADLGDGRQAYDDD